MTSLLLETDHTEQICNGLTPSAIPLRLKIGVYTVGFHWTPK